MSISPSSSLFLTPGKQQGTAIPFDQQRRGARVRPILLLGLLGGLLLAPPLAAHDDTPEASQVGVADAPAFQGDAVAALAAARDAGLFFGFARSGDQFTGEFVSFQLQGNAVTNLYAGASLIAERIEAAVAPVVHMAAPVVAIGEDAAISVHDNRYAWTTIRGELDTVTITLPAPAQVSSGRVFAEAGEETVHVFLPLGGRLDVDGKVVTASFDDGWAEVVLATEPGPFGQGPEAMAWILGVLDGPNAALDILSVDGSPVGLEAAAQGVLAVDLVVLVQSPDQVLRIESAGFFDEAPLSELAGHRRGLGFYPASEPAQVYGPGTGVGAFHARRDGALTITDVRLPLRPGGLVDGGVVWVEWDREAPRVTLHEVLPGDPPRIRVETSEATAARWWTGADDALEATAYTGDTRPTHEFILEQAPAARAGSVSYRIELQDAVGRTVMIEDKISSPEPPGRGAPGVPAALLAGALLMAARRRGR